ncbi:F-box domain containing protein [Trema orientale]|uniref:F-box domain containing protein n=1 Tax=Trema orientale TaxID=63057 RepID=A0A2P5FJ58_TREOI|nr:F-box domain containing protein [Trema orientale]
MSSLNEEDGADRTASDYLPWDVVSEILVKSPVRSLIRFKRVCKQWNSTLNKYVYFVHRGNHSTGDNFTQLEHRIVERKFHALRKVGSHNGIVCFLGYDSSMSTIILWNPSLQQSIDVGVWRAGTPEYYDSHPKHVCFGFGYDSRSEDYRVVKLLYKESEQTTSCRVKLYSLRRNWWETINIHYTRLPCKIREFGWLSQTLEAGRRVHWLANCENSNGEGFRRILSFDVRGKVFGQIALPRGDRDYRECNHQRVELASFVLDHRDRKGLLTLFEYDDEEDCNNGSRFRCYAWVMKKYGSVDSWTKLELNISLSKQFMVVGFLSESVLLIRVTGEGMIWYDTNTQRKECLAIDDDTKILSYVGCYMESVFSLKRSPRGG